MSGNLLIMERVFAAPPATVFAFITERENLLKWWGPAGTSVAENHLNLSALGAYWFIMVDPSGGRTRVTGDVLRLDPPRMVEFSLIVHSSNGPPMIDSVVRFELAPVDTGSTHFTLTQSGLSDEEIELQSKYGWASTLTRLETLFHT